MPAYHPRAACQILPGQNGDFARLNCPDDCTPLLHQTLVHQIQMRVAGDILLAIDNLIQ